MPCAHPCPRPCAVQAEWAQAVGEESRLLREHQLRLEAELRAAQAAAADAAAAAAAAAAACPESADECASASGSGQDSASAVAAGEAGVKGAAGDGAPEPADGPQEGLWARGWEVGDLRESLAAQSGLTQARATALCVQTELQCRSMALG